MSKRQVIFLLGVFMANLWGSVVYAPAFTGTRGNTPRTRSKLAPSRPSFDSGSDDSIIYQRNPRSSSSSSKSGSDDDLISIDSRNEINPGQSRLSFDSESADKAAYDFVVRNALRIAQSLYNDGLMVVSFDDIERAYQKLRGISLKEQEFVNEVTKLYIQGAITAFVDSMTSKIAADQRGVDAWLHQHAAKLIAYFESKNVTSIGNYAAILDACKKLGITPLAAKKEKIKQRILNSLNNSLENESGSIPEDLNAPLQAILQRLFAEHAHDVTKARVIKTAKALRLPKDVVAGIYAMPEDSMQKLLQDWNEKLDTPTVPEDPRIVERALAVLKQVGEKQKDNVISVLDVLRAAGKDGGESERKRPRMENNNVTQALNVIAAVGNDENIR